MLQTLSANIITPKAFCKFNHIRASKEWQIEGSIQERAVAAQALRLLQGPSLAEKAGQTAEALKVRTEEAAERAKEGLKSAAGTARLAAQRAAGSPKGTAAAQQAEERAAEGARTTEQTVAQDAERVTSLYRDSQEARQGPQPGAQQPSAQARAPDVLLCLVL